MSANQEEDGRDNVVPSFCGLLRVLALKASVCLHEGRSFRCPWRRQKSSRNSQHPKPRSSSLSNKTRWPMTTQQMATSKEQTLDGLRIGRSRDLEP